MDGIMFKLTPLFLEGGAADTVNEAVTDAKLQRIFNAGEAMIGYAGQILGKIVENPILCIGLAVSFTWMAIGLIKGLRRG